MLALEDLVDLGESLRRAGSKVSTQQLLATQRLLLSLAAEGGLPASRFGLASWIAPVLCTSAAEQETFEDRYRDWLHKRFGDATPPPPPPPPAPPRGPAPRPWPRIPFTIAAALLVAGAAWFVGTWRGAPQTAPVAPAAAPASAPAASPGSDSLGMGGLDFVDRFAFGAAAAPPTLAERVDGRNLAWVAAPLLLYLLWLLRWLLRQPVLQRIASRTPSQLSEVHVPGAVRALLPGLPLRRLAQELRRRRDVASNDLQAEPTVQATLARGGVFTPVRGARAEPDYLVLIDRAGLSDHQARLAGEIADELARSDVLIERYEFNRDARVVRSRGHGPQHAVELAELQERLPDHRVLVFGDGSGCLDAATGAPTPWTRLLASWSVSVLLTPLPAERWGRREWLLQRLGIQVLPLDAEGLRGLMGVVAGLTSPAPGAERPARAGARAYERSPRRWLERHPPSQEIADRIVRDLRIELGPRGLAWLAACAAYPEVHWGITLRLGKVLVPEPALFEQLLPRIARLVWFRDGYLPDWMRERLLEELSADDEQLARTTLRAMLEIAARGGDDVPLVIAQGKPDKGETAWQRLRRWWQARGDAARAQALLHSAERDSPLRDHVFLRFLSGRSRRRIDLRAPGSLLVALRRTPALGPIVLACAAVLASTGLAAGWPPVHLGKVTSSLTSLRFSRDAQRVVFAAQVGLAARGRSPETRIRSTGFEARSGKDGWRQAADGIAGSWQVVAPGADVVVFERAGQLVARKGTMERLLSASSSPIGRVEAAFSADASRFALADDRGVQVWDLDGELLPRSINWGSAPVSMDIDAAGQRVALISTDGVARLWEVGSSAARVLPVSNVSRFGVIRFSPDGRSVAALGDGTVRLWDANTGQVLAEHRSSASSTRLAYSGDSRSFATWGGTSAARVMETRTAALVTRVTELEASSDLIELVFGADGKRVAGINATGELRLWDAVTGRAIGEPRRGTQTTCCDPRLAFSPDGLWLASAIGTELALWRTDRPSSAPAVVPSGDGIVPGPVPLAANVGWMAAATLLTAMMVPALALFCGGLYRRGVQVLLSMACTFAVVLLLWVAVGYSLAFTDANAYLGGLDRAFFRGMFDVAQGGLPAAPTFSKGVVLPEWLFALFTAAVAAFAACLLVGGLVERVQFGALLSFVVLWFLFAFVPITHMVWYWAGPDAYADKTVVDALNARAGLAWQWGVLDFAGGLVVFMNPAIAGLVCLLYRRRAGGAIAATPRSASALAGVAVPLLWTGAFGCFAGSALEAGNSAVLAGTELLTVSVGAVLAGSLFETTLHGRPSVRGTAWAALAGLAAGAATVGNVGLVGALVIGLTAGLIAPLSAVLLQRLLGPDEALLYFGTLGSGALVGALSVGVFNSQLLGGPGLVGDWVTATVTSNGVIGQLVIQAKSVLLTIVWSALVSLMTCMVVDFVWGWRLRPSEAPEPAVAETAEGLAYTQRRVWMIVSAFCIATGLVLGALAWGQAGAIAAAPAVPAASADSAASAPAQVAASAPPQAEAASPAAQAASVAPAPVARGGDVAWMLVATALVLVAAPGIGLFCSGLLRQRDTAAAAARVLIVSAIAILFWFVLGYSLAYTEGNGYVGGFDRLLLKGVFSPNDGAFAMAATFNKSVYIPELLFIAYQAAIVAFAASLLAAVLGERLRFSALLAFIVVWLTFAYAPLAHMSLFWMGPDAYASKEVVDAMNAKAGLIWQWGALDYAGGFSLSIGATVAGLVCTLQSPQRTEESQFLPPSLLLMLTGAALLWLAGYGLHGGAALEAGSFSPLAAVANLLVPVTAAAAWGVSELLSSGRMSAKELASGAVAGVLATTTAAGAVGVAGAVVIGTAAGFLGRVAAVRLERWRANDELLALLGGLFAAAAVGALLTGVFNSERLNGPGLVGDYVTMSVTSNGFGAQLWIQMKALMLTTVWSAAVSLVAIRIVDRRP